jgi:hypothetical protein
MVVMSFRTASTVLREGRCVKCRAAGLSTHLVDRGVPSPFELIVRPKAFGTVPTRAELSSPRESERKQSAISDSGHIM